MCIRDRSYDTLVEIQAALVVLEGAVGDDNSVLNDINDQLTNAEISDFNNFKKGKLDVSRETKYGFRGSY